MGPEHAHYNAKHSQDEEDDFDAGFNMITHTCSRCGHAQEYEQIGASKNDPHGEHVPPKGDLCEGCEKVLVEIGKRLELFAGEVFDCFTSGEATPALPHLFDELHRRAPHMADAEKEFEELDKTG